jgi:hypothetical protein
MRRAMVTSVRALPPEPTKADAKLCRVAGGLATAARAGDEAGVARLLGELLCGYQPGGPVPFRLVRLFMILAAEAQQDAVLAAAGFSEQANLRELHRQAKWLRRQGMTIGDMPPHVVAGERMYRRLAKRAAKQLAAAGE